MQCRGISLCSHLKLLERQTTRGLSGEAGSLRMVARPDKLDHRAVKSGGIAGQGKQGTGLAIALPEGEMAVL